MKPHKRINVPKRDPCYAHLKYATYHNGLDCPAEAGRAVINAIERLPQMTTPDCVEGDDVSDFSDCLHRQFAELETLDAFLDS